MTESIWKTKKSNLYLCKYCLSHINNPLFKSMIISSTIKTKSSKCFICNRYLYGIYYGPELLNIINTEPNNLSKYSTIYYNDIYDNIGFDLMRIYNYSHEQVKNIYQQITNLKGLPSENYINEMAEDFLIKNY